MVTPFWEEDFSHTLDSFSMDRNGAPGTFVDRSDDYAKVSVGFPGLKDPVPSAMIDTKLTITGSLLLCLIFVVLGGYTLSYCNKIS